MAAERSRLEKEISNLQSQIKNLPDGKLICTRNENRYKWYQSDGHSQNYIPQKDRILAEQLAAKKYLSCRLQDLLHEKYAIELYLKHHHSNTCHCEELLTNPSAYQELLAPFFQTTSQELLAWMNSPYDCNPKFRFDMYVHFILVNPSFTRILLSVIRIPDKSITGNTLDLWMIRFITKICFTAPAVLFSSLFSVESITSPFQNLK